MVQSSFQKEIPPARVNITLNAASQKSMRKAELPLKVLVIGDFDSQCGSEGIARRRRIPINSKNLDETMLGMQLGADVFIQKLDETIRVDVSSIKDFHPESLAQNVPQLKKLLGMRNLLKEFKALLMDNRNLRKEVESSIKDSEILSQIIDENFSTTKEGDCDLC